MSDVDWGKAALIAAPVVKTGVGWYFHSKNQNLLDWFDRLKKPSWLITNPILTAALDLGTAIPIGYAAHLVSKEVRSNDRQIAMSLYGASFLVWMGSSYIYIRSKNLKSWLGILSLATGIFGATAAAFYKINKDAGLMLVPITAWYAYYAVGTMGIMQANPVV